MSHIGNDRILCFICFGGCPNVHNCFLSFSVKPSQQQLLLSFSFIIFLQFSFWRRTHFFLAQWLCGRGHYMPNGTVTFPIWRDSIVGMWTHLDSKSSVVWEERRGELEKKKEKNTPYWDGLSHLLCVLLCPKSSIVLKVSFKQYRFAPQ